MNVDFYRGEGRGESVAAFFFLVKRPCGGQGLKGRDKGKKEKGMRGGQRGGMETHRAAIRANK